MALTRDRQPFSETTASSVEGAGNADVCEVLVINLADRVDRLAGIRDHLEGHGLSWSRIEALRPSPDQASEIGCPALVTAAEVGCWLSHQRAYERLLESGRTFGLILEDDARLVATDWAEVLPILTRAMSVSGLGVLQIGWISSHYRTPIGLSPVTLGRVAFSVARQARSNGRGIQVPSPVPALKGVRLIKDSFRAGGHAYLVSRTAAGELRRLNLPVALSADGFLDAVARQGREGLRIARVSTSLAEQVSRIGSGPIDSNIGVG